MTRIKLCGLMRPEDIETANRLTPDYIGFVFAGKSRRRVTQAQAEELAEDNRAAGKDASKEESKIKDAMEDLKKLRQRRGIQ